MNKNDGDGVKTVGMWTARARNDAGADKDDMKGRGDRFSVKGSNTRSEGSIQLELHKSRYLSIIGFVPRLATVGLYPGALTNLSS